MLTLIAGAHKPFNIRCSHSIETITEQNNEPVSIYCGNNSSKWVNMFREPSQKYLAQFITKKLTGTVESTGFSNACSR